METRHGRTAPFPFAVLRYPQPAARGVAAGWAFVNGGAGLAFAFRLKRDEGGRLLASGAVLSLLLAVALIPPGVAEALHLVLGVYGLPGGLLLALSLRLHRLTVP